MTSAMWALLFLVACAMMGNGLIVPVLPQYGEVFSSSATMVGMLITLFGVARLASNLPTGLVHDRLGSRPMLMVGNGLLLAGAIGAAVAGSLEFLLACRFVQGVGSGVFLTSVGIILARSSNPGTRGRLMAFYQGAIFIGASAGPAVGGYIAHALGLAAPFWAYAAISFLALVVSAFINPATESLDEGKPKKRLPISSLFADLRFAANLGMAFSSGFARTAALWQCIPLLAAQRFGMGLDMIGLAVTVTAVANVVVLPLSGWMTDRFGTRLLPPASAVAFAAALALIATSSSLAGFWAGVVLCGIAGGMNGPSMASALVEASPPQLIGPAMGTQRTVGDLGFVLGPIIVGLLADTLGLDSAGGLILTASLLLASGALWVVLSLKPAPVSGDR